MTKSRRLVSRKISRAIHEFEMLLPGDRVLIGLSGGKDSLVLLHELSARRKFFSHDFELHAIHVQTEFSSPQIAPFLQEQCASLRTPLAILPVSVTGRLQPGKTMNCYWCSTQRRTELLRYAMENQFNSIALGHHMDDTLETVIMNWMQKGDFSGMAPHLRYDNYPLRLIRPLVYVSEQELIAYVEDLNLSRFTCTCDYGNNSERKRIRRIVHELTRGQYNLKMNMLKAVRAAAWSALKKSQDIHTVHGAG